MIKTKYGRIEGFRESGMTKYYGVPFAKPPVGKLRFRKPEEPDAWEGILKATEAKKNPMQSNAVYVFDRYSEDCLYLNIWVPDHKEDEKLPVMVWIPGGAYELGGANCVTDRNCPDYDCTFMAEDTHCIVVSVTYRLNVFGFLNFSKYSDHFDDNLGMLDAILALKWINENIESFGGDSSCVTLFGESAGAGVISALLVCDEATPLFHRAIMESNCWECYHDTALEEIMVMKFLELLGITPENVDEILSMSYEKLFTAVNALDMFMCEKYFLRCTYAPVIDGTLLKEFPTLSKMENLDKDILIGSNRNEGNYQAALYKVTEANAAHCRDLMFQFLDDTDRTELEKCYSIPDVQAMADIFTDVLYMFPKIRFAEHVTDNSKKKVYVYRYDYVTPFQKQVNLLSCHVSELIPLFNCSLTGYRTWMAGDEETLKEIGNRMRMYWGAFAHTGVPEVPGQAEWKPYDRENRYTLLIDREDSLLKDPEKESRLLYEGIDRVLI